MGPADWTPRAIDILRRVFSLYVLRYMPGGHELGTQYTVACDSQVRRICLPR